MCIGVCVCVCVCVYRAQGDVVQRPIQTSCSTGIRCLFLEERRRIQSWEALELTTLCFTELNLQLSSFVPPPLIFNHDENHTYKFSNQYKSRAIKAAVVRVRQ